MKISTKGRYGLRIMLDIARNSAGGPVKIPEISARQGISAKYTEQITGILTKSGLLRSLRGAQGGYELIKSPSDYTVGEILRKTEGDLSPVECLYDYCDRAEGCATKTVWKGLSDCINNYLNGITLQDLLDSEGNPSDYYSI